MLFKGLTLGSSGSDSRVQGLTLGFGQGLKWGEAPSGSPRQPVFVISFGLGEEKTLSPSRKLITPLPFEASPSRSSDVCGV